MLTSHVLTGVVHGGIDDFASLTLWIDSAAGEAHLTGHSGSPVPLDGPVAPDHAEVFCADGKSGWITEFDAEEIEDIVERLTPHVTTLLSTGAGPEAHDAREAIQEVLEDIELSRTPYEEWLRENEPDTHADLYEE